MESAGSHSYVSKNFMDAYLQKKQKVQAKKDVKREAPKHKIKEALKEDMKEPLATIIEESSMASSASLGLRRRRSISRSDSGSDDGERLERCRSLEMICEGELGGRLNLSDSEGDEPDFMPQRPQQTY